VQVEVSACQRSLKRHHSIPSVSKDKLTRAHDLRNNQCVFKQELMSESVKTFRKWSCDVLHLPCLKMVRLHSDSEATGKWNVYFGASQRPNGKKRQYLKVAQKSVPVNTSAFALLHLYKQSCERLVSRLTRCLCLSMSLYCLTYFLPTFLPYWKYVSKFIHCDTA